MPGLIIIGLKQVKVGEAAPSGTMPTVLNKIGKVYKDTIKINQETAEVTEHFEESKSAPIIRRKQKKIPKVTFSLMDCDMQALSDYVGGEVINGVWGFNGDEIVANKAIFLESEQGADFEIPNGDIEAIINADMSAKGIFLVDLTVTPLVVTEGKAFRSVPKEAV